jgi:hypothetical protein
LFESHPGSVELFSDSLACQTRDPTTEGEKGGGSKAINQVTLPPVGTYSAKSQIMIQDGPSINRMSHQEISEFTKGRAEML